MDNFAFIFMGGFFGFAIIFFIIWFVVVMPRINKMKAREKQEKLDRKHAEEKQKIELEMHKKHAELELEAKRGNIHPRFCQYCGTKHDAGAKNCDNCGAAL